MKLKPNKKIKLKKLPLPIKILLIIALFIAFIIGLNCIYVVPNDAYAVITRFSKIVDIKSEAGLYTKNPISDSVRQVSKQVQLFDIAQSDVITKDKKSMVADNYVLWKVVDPTLYMKTLAGAKSSAEDRVSVSAYNATKNVISSMTQDEIIESRGLTLTNILTEEANSDIGTYGLEITEVSIKTFDLPDDNKQSVYNRMISERSNIAASYTAKGNSDATKIRNETDKNVAILKADATKKAATIKAEGEQSYMQKLSEAYNSPEKAEFYEYTRSLEMIKNSLKGSSNKTLILDKDSELAKILYGVE